MLPGAQNGQIWPFELLGPPVSTYAVEGLNIPTPVLIDMANIEHMGANIEQY